VLYDSEAGDILMERMTTEISVVGGEVMPERHERE